MHDLVKKLGFGNKAAAIVMVIVGLLILYKPDLMAWLFAAYLIVIGILKLVLEK
ncbi:TPA: DUF3096 domain-containing protein [archaeon]|nr:DUF3096 domain-containing protein [Candidatus Naiadarchaeales archaeon SRR2090159.bin1288]